MLNVPFYLLCSFTWIIVVKIFDEWDDNSIEKTATDIKQSMVKVTIRMVIMLGCTSLPFLW